MAKWSWHLVGDLRVMGSNHGRNLQTIFDCGLPQKNPTNIPSQIKVHLYND